MAAYAEAGHFGEAVETVKRALSLIATQNNKPLADALQMRLKLYEANAPFHEKRANPPHGSPGALVEWRSAGFG